MKKVKDPVSGFTHLLGAVLSVLGLVLMIIYCAIYSNEKAWDIVSCTIFGTGLILLYTFSSLYHLLNLKEKGTRVFRKFDHIMIYILIAATYTPICLGPLRGGWGWSIFGIVWGLAILGTILTAVWLDAPRWLTTSIYIAMGNNCGISNDKHIFSNSKRNGSTRMATSRGNILYNWWINIWIKMAKDKYKICWIS